MKPTALLHLYRIRLRSRRGAELLAILGVAVGVALIFAALIANTSLAGSVREQSEEIFGKADFQLSARSAEGFDQRIVRRVRSIKGAVAGPVAEARVNLRGPSGTRSVLLVGGDPRLKGRRGLFLPRSTLAGLGLETGRQVTVQSGAGTARTWIAGELDRGEFGALAGSPVALASLTQAQALTGMRGRVSRVFVDAAPERGRAIEGRLGQIAGERLDLAPADREVTLFERASYPTNASTSLFSALSALVGFLFALNAVLLSVPQRRRLIADLRLSGFAPSAVIAVAALDALLLGLAGSALGLSLGEAASRLLFDSAPGYLASAFAVGSERIVTWQSAAIAAGAGVLAAGLAVLVPILDLLSRSGEGHPAGAPAAAGRGPVFAGAALLGAALALIALAPTLAFFAIATLLVALLLLLGAWLRRLAAAIVFLCSRLRSPVAILAALELRAGSARLRNLVLAGTGAVAVFAAVSIGGARADLQRGLDVVAEDVDRGAEVWVAFRGPTNIFATTAVAMTSRQVREFERLRAVRAVSRNRGSFLDVGEARVWVLAPAPSRIGPLLRHQVEEGNPEVAADRLRSGGWVALSRALASEQGVGVGDPVELPLPVPRRLRVAAVTDNFGWPGGAIAISAPDYARAWGSDAVSSLGIQLRDGTSTAAVADSVRRILGRGSPLRVETSDERTGRQRAASRAGLSRLDQISALVLIASALAMAASMAGLVWQRRPLLAALKLHGYGEGELWLALLLETGLLLGAGCLAGALFGLAGQAILARALETITGFPVVYETAWSATLQVTLLLSLAAVAILALPGWLAVRLRPQAGFHE